MSWQEGELVRCQFPVSFLGRVAAIHEIGDYWVENVETGDLILVGPRHLFEHTPPERHHPMDPDNRTIAAYVIARFEPDHQWAMPAGSFYQALVDAACRADASNLNRMFRTSNEPVMRKIGWCVWQATMNHDGFPRLIRIASGAEPMPKLSGSDR